MRPGSMSRERPPAWASLGPPCAGFNAARLHEPGEAGGQGSEQPVADTASMRPGSMSRERRCQMGVTSSGTGMLQCGPAP